MGDNPTRRFVFSMLRFNEPGGTAARTEQVETRSLAYLIVGWKANGEKRSNQPVAVEVALV